MEELSARLGDQTCQQIASHLEHTPEHACDQIQGINKRTNHTQINHTKAHKHKRPLWLFEQPKPVNRDHIQLLHGPERIQTAWWTEDQNATCRDYYIAKHKMGVECWAFLDSNQQWFLHGYFG